MCRKFIISQMGLISLSLLGPLALFEAARRRQHGSRASDGQCLGPEQALMVASGGA